MAFETGRLVCECVVVLDKSFTQHRTRHEQVLKTPRPGRGGLPELENVCKNLNCVVVLEL